MNRDAIRGRVWSVLDLPRGRRTWHYEVTVGEVVVLEDNTGASAPMIRDCNRDVMAARRVIGAGHRLRPYAELVTKAEGRATR